MRRFEAGRQASGPAGVAAYLSALAASGGLARLASGDDETSLPRLLLQLHERALGARAPLALGEKGERPLHVVVVDPRAARPWPLRLASELASSLLILLLLSVAWAAGSAALRRAATAPGPALGLSSAAAAPSSAASLGGNPSFAPKEYIKSDLPEKSVKTFADVLGCDEAKEELQEGAGCLAHVTA